jgi:hypothetical protein
MRQDVAGNGDAAIPLFTGSTLIEPVRRWLANRAAVPRESPPLRDLRTPGPLPRQEHASQRVHDGSVDEMEVSQLENATRIFRDCEGRQAGGLRRRAVIGQLYEITEMLEHPFPEELTRRLFGTVAELAALAGTMAHEEGLEATGQKYFVLALHAASQADDGTLGAEIVSRMARQMLQLGYPQDALDLIRCARQGSTGEAGASVRSLFLLVEAWSYAHLGQVEETHRAVGEAQAAFAGSQPGDAPPWLSFEAADLVGMAGHAYRLLSEHDPEQAMHAEPLIRQALALRQPGEVRDRALHLIDLAMTCLLKGDLEQACAAGEEALTLVDQLRTSAHLIAQVRVLQAQAELHSASPAARRLATRMNRLLGTEYAVRADDDVGYRGDTTTASIPGPACAPTTAPTSLR